MTVRTPPEYFNDPVPGAGRRAPRADFLSTAGRVSLNGEWKFILSPTATGIGEANISPKDPSPEWGTITVPSHWVLQGYDTPLYTNTAFPIPIDPPRVPMENPTGDYQRTFELPASWTSKGTVLRFQGVDSCAMVWLNGELLGHSKGSRLPFEFDVGELLVPDTNTISVRVQRWSSGTYLEDQDMWWLPGIFRDVELLERPSGSINDHQVHADFDHLSGLGTLCIDADVPGLIDIDELGITDLATGETFTGLVIPWTAEQPKLYRGVLRVDGGGPESERITLAVGFRTVTIDNGQFMVNGAPVLFRGVNRHEHHPELGRALTTEIMRADLVLMKRHNINAVRTSHYPPHPQFLRLCDELGMWVVDECDIETHGFIYTDWAGNPPADPAWTPALMDRIQRMVERDKNHPSVVIWSLANESSTGDAFGTMETWIRERDPSRPLHYERDPSYQNSDFYSLMYPSQEALELIGKREEPTPDGIQAGSPADERRRKLPFLLCEYAHAMGNGPGSLTDYQEILERHERFAGAFVWEWIDHGISAVDPRGKEYFQHGGDIDFLPNGGSYCIDGLIFPDRTPSPGLLEYKKAIEPVGFSFTSSGVRIHNKRDFAALADLELHWRLEVDGIETGRGELAMPYVGPRSMTTIPWPVLPVLPELPGEGAGECWLTLSARLREATGWAPAGHELAWGQFAFGDQTPSRRTKATVATSDVEYRGADSSGVPLADGQIRLGPAIFDADTGRMTHWSGEVVDGPRLDVWRAATENDKGQGSLNNLVLGWQALGLDRMLHSTLSVNQESTGELLIHSRVAPAGQDIALHTRYHWKLLDDGALRLEISIAPDGVWADTPVGGHTVTLPRLGLRMSLPGHHQDLSWFGLGPGESYRDSRDGVKVGRYRSTIDALKTDYVVPQENGNRSGTRWMELAGALRVEGPGHFDFSARRWTSEDLHRANHPHELRDSGRVWLNLDLMQQGLGSAACGPATPSGYEVPVEGASFSLVFAEPAK